ncbi:MAG: tRNA (adenosine(37)-N6)-threonylcarbamoyltransferase complex dimerization subunit type 1 TsaB [Thermoanaerobaculia bacterium]
MTVIAFDTASPVPSVAVLRGGDLFEQKLSTERRASEDLLPALDACLAAAGARLADCERIVVCAGPGSFTGVRIGLATAWGLRRALGIPLETVSTLEAMAEAARSTGADTVATLLDAGRGEIVMGRFDLRGPRAAALAPPRRVPATEALRASEGAALFGLPAGIIPGARPLPVTPCAALARAASRAPRGDAPEAPEAIYSRPSAAEEKHGAA